MGLGSKQGPKYRAKVLGSFEKWKHEHSLNWYTHFWHFLQESVCVQIVLHSFSKLMRGSKLKLAWRLATVLRNGVINLITHL